MTPQLSPELVNALRENSGPLEVVDPTTDRVYVLCDSDLHQRVRAILDHQAIEEGIRQMEAGESQPLSEAFDEIRQNLRSRNS